MPNFRQTRNYIRLSKLVRSRTPQVGVNIANLVLILLLLLLLLLLLIIMIFVIMIMIIIRPCTGNSTVVSKAGGEDGA